MFKNIYLWKKKIETIKIVSIDLKGKEEHEEFWLVSSFGTMVRPADWKSYNQMKWKEKRKGKLTHDYALNNWSEKLGKSVFLFFFFFLSFFYSFLFGSNQRKGKSKKAIMCNSPLLFFFLFFFSKQLLSHNRRYHRRNLLFHPGDGIVGSKIICHWNSYLNQYLVIDRTSKINQGEI